MTRLDLVVGPNGAGKSTFVELVLADARPWVPFVNADVIAEERWPEDPLSHAYEAAQAAEVARDRLIARGEPFIAETVGSHESKVELVRRARGRGFYVHVMVIAVPEDYSVERVAARVAAGGHDVPEAKIRSRWQRVWANVVEMVELADSAEVFDNAGPAPITIATFVDGDIVGSPRWPDWIPLTLSARWPLDAPLS